MSLDFSRIYHAMASDQFLAGAGSAVAVWLLTGGAIFFYKRLQVRSLLLFEINDQLKGITEAVADLTTLIEDKIKVGQPLTQAGRFIPTKNSFFEALQSDLLGLFPVATKRMLISYHLLEMIQQLVVCLYEELTAEAARQQPLNAAEKGYYEAKLVRIVTLIHNLGPIPIVAFKASPAIREVSAVEIRTLIEGCRPSVAKKALRTN